MDENSCEDETSKGVENVEDAQKAKSTENTPELENMGVRIVVGGKISKNVISDRCGSSCDASGPSTDFITQNEELKNTESMPVKKNLMQSSLTNGENEVVPIQSSQTLPLVVINTQPTNQPLVPVVTDEHSAPLEGSCNVPCILPNYENRPDFPNRVRMAPGVKEHLTSRKTSIGPPPSYSFVMKQKKKLKPVPSPDSLVIDRPPPPSYTGSRGLFLRPEESRIERICNLPSFVEPVWRSHSQPALCSRCGVIVLTTIHSHDSVATHVAALALCLFGCWPCCLLPYCMNACKNTYHHCPICQAFLGLYTPWLSNNGMSF